MKRILFPTDFSDIATNAFLYALKMADSLEAEIILLHTFDMPLIDTAEIPINYKEIYDTLEVQQMAEFEDHIPKLNQIASNHGMSHIKLSHVLKSGDLTYAMKEAVAAQNIDLVVMGTGGVSNWLDTIFGSQTSEAFLTLSVPVLSVPAGASFETIKNIGFTNMYREKDFLALQKLVDIASKLNAKIKSIYVKKSFTPIYEDEIRLWESQFARHDVQFFVIPHDDVKETIQDFIDNQDIDILTILTEKKGFFEELFTSSLTEKLSYRLETPLLVLHED